MPAEMCIYLDSLSAIIVIAQNSFDLSITDIAVVIYIFCYHLYLSQKTILHAHSVQN